jgi:hypothetical protein
MPGDQGISVPCNPDLEEGFQYLTFGQWLRSQLDKRRLRNKDLLRELETRGFHCGGNNISNWLTDQSPPGLERVPLICDALGMKTEEREQWVLEWLKAYLPPTIHPYLRDPLKEKTRILQALMSTNKKSRGRPVYIRNGNTCRPHKFIRGPFKGKFVVSKERYAKSYIAVEREADLWNYIDDGYCVRFSAKGEPPSLVSPKSISEE